ncbi:hypothetical protein HNP60_001280 [Sphingobium sp. B1D3A]|uniref:Ice-binding protein C-terminal domain-containing protein n=1 Tax=Sphingobium lignivorans TaxID=2735886 RepID=A0ABR6NDI1_9SPHN|nr:PEPxxWA-CTERM sorting domain-containing protein [Sphingobium lignivorans]MBB5985306.1 hypothetical protein [Sphingobium lignivorans]
MKKMFLAALLAGFAMPAHAAEIAWGISFDATEYIGTVPGAPLQEIYHENVGILIGGDCDAAMASCFLTSNIPGFWCDNCSYIEYYTDDRIYMIFHAPGGTLSLNMKFRFDHHGRISKAWGLTEGSISIQPEGTGYATHYWWGDFDTINRGVPEPATWAMMIGGFALAGGALRRRRGMAARVQRVQFA